MTENYFQLDFFAFSDNEDSKTKAIKQDNAQYESYVKLEHRKLRQWLKKSKA